jgi:hypothetical protein
MFSFIDVIEINVLELSLRDSYKNPSESMQIEPFRIFFFYETNPQIESFENCITNRIRESNLLNTASQIKSANQIF